MTDPAVSVVIATRNRARLLPRLAEALGAQECGAPFEVVVVDDGSDDGTWAELLRLQARPDLVLRPIRMDANVGAAMARNAGWRAARAPVVAFTDDDCTPQPGWLAALVAGLDGHDLAQGCTMPDPDQWDTLGPFGHTIDVSGEYGYYETCNMAYRREALERVDGFDPAFRYPYGEDTDLAWRVKRSGGGSTFVPDAVVFHDVWPSDYRAYLRDRRRREGIVLAFSRHPELRAARGLFLDPTHPRAVLAAAALVVVARRPTPARLAAAWGLGLAYAWTCRQLRPRPPRRWQWLGVVPRALVADLYEVAVLARASVRYRTLVL